MARSTPRVEETVLVGLPDAAISIVVGSPAWYAWLEQATSFAFSSAAGGFTARKEQRGQAGWYWKAYRKRDGTLHHAYLGKSTDLSLDRLNAIAGDLAGRGAGAPAIEAARMVGAVPSAADGERSPQPAARLPTGTITFCFTDIEGSTQLWEQHTQAMPAALARHDSILRDTIRAHHGVVFKMVGDGVHAVFVHAADALAAAIDAQHALAGEVWQAFAPIDSAQPRTHNAPSAPAPNIVLRVRMALHAGAAEQRDGDYFGTVVNRIARIVALGHGGQILLSQATYDLVAHDPPAQTALRALGEYQLKDLSRPEQIFQLTSADLPADFPPLRTQDAQAARPAADTAALLATKLHIPAPRPQIVPRPRLLERVQAGLLGKLTLICAPAGFGKTTLLASWIVDCRLQIADYKDPNLQRPEGTRIYNLQSPQVAWVSLDADDNDATRFWTYVIAALETVYPTLDTTAGALLRSQQPPPMDVIVTSLINAITPLHTETALVLDDYHLIITPAIHQTLAFLLDHLPPRLHLVMLTRADPPLPLTRLRMHAELTEVRATDLRFTSDEAAEFLTDVMRLPLTSDQVAALEARTEGWIAGLQLAALAMQNRADYAGFVAAFSGSHRFVVDYLVEEVLACQPAHLQMFLTQTAILDRMCGPLCDALLGMTSSASAALGTRHSSQAYSQLILDQLERANLFLVSLDDERRWYRYQHLFAEVLRARLYSGATAGELAALHQRASIWYEQAGLIDEAVRYAGVHDSERVADLIELHATTMMLKEGNVLLVRGWLEHVPRALMLVRPQLTLIAGLVMALTAQFSEAEQLLLDAAPALSAPDLSTDLLGQLAELHATIARFQGNAARSLAYAQQALALLAPDNMIARTGACLNIAVASMWQGDATTAQAAFAEAAALGERSGILWIALAALEELMSLQGRQGELRQVLQTATQAAQLSARLGGQKLSPTGMGLVGSAEVLYEWNDLVGAAQASAMATELLRGSVERLLLVRGSVALAQVCQAHGDYAGAIDALGRCEAWFTQTKMEASFARAWLAAHQARLWVRQGDLAAAARWAQACGDAGDSELGYVQQLTLVQIHLAQHHTGAGGQALGEASAIVAQLIPAVAARGWTRYQIAGLALQALIHQAQGEQTSALSVLERALALAEPEGYIRTFVDLGVPMRLQIADCRSQISHSARSAASQDRHRLRAYMDRLLAAFPRNESHDAIHAALSPQPSARVELLSERELEVLRLIAEGHSNQAIADRLIVAISTVKRHINNIYGKLDVQSRTQALVRARDLQIL